MRSILISLCLTVFISGCRSAETAPEASAAPPAPETQAEAESRAKLREALRAHEPEIRDCYEKALKKDPSLQGKLIMQWDIGEKGRVFGVRVVRSLTPDVDDCIALALENWTFPVEPEAGKIRRVMFPFAFSPGDAGEKSESP